MTFAEQLEQRGYKLGYQEGYQEGRQEVINEFVLALLAEGISVEKVAQNMQLPLEKLFLYSK